MFISPKHCAAWNLWLRTWWLSGLSIFVGFRFVGLNFKPKTQNPKPKKFKAHTPKTEDLKFRGFCEAGKISDSEGRENKGRPEFRG